MAVTHTSVNVIFTNTLSGIMHKNSVSGSSSGSQERTSKGVTFASDYTRIVSDTFYLLLLITTFQYILKGGVSDFW